MNEAKPGEVITVSAVQFVRHLPGDPRRVWSHLTECDKLSGWYGEDGEIEAREGGRVWLMGGHIRGVVTQWQPERHLAYTWNVFDPGDTKSQHPESYLSLTLEAAGDDTQLTLFHLPIPERYQAQTQMGWHTYLDMLNAALHGEDKSREAFMEKNAALYGVDLDNLAR